VAPWWQDVAHPAGNAPRIAIAQLPQALGAGTEVAHTELGAAPATGEAVVSDGVSNRTRDRAGDRSRTAVGHGAAPPLLSAVRGWEHRSEHGAGTGQTGGAGQQHAAA